MATLHPPRQRPVIGLLESQLDRGFHRAGLLGISFAARAEGADLVCFDGGGLAQAGTAASMPSALYHLVSPTSIDGLIIWASAPDWDRSTGVAHRVPPQQVGGIIPYRKRGRMNDYFSHAHIEHRMSALGPPPADRGILQLIVARPEPDARRILTRGELDVATGLVGDNWRERGAPNTPNGRANPEAQITLMSSRVIDALTGDRERWALAGDQLFVDLDLSEENLPPGQRLAIGTAILEVTAAPHTGCAKFTQRFGHDAIKWVNSLEGRRQRRRGMNTKVIQSGQIAVGDEVVKIER